MSVRCSLRVLFEDPFWIGVYERWDEGKYQACKVIFGAEPKDFEVYAYMFANWKTLPMSQPVSAPVETEERGAGTPLCPKAGEKTGKAQRPLKVNTGGSVHAAAGVFPFCQQKPPQQKNLAQRFAAQSPRHILVALSVYRLRLRV